MALLTPNTYLGSVLLDDRIKMFDAERSDECFD